MGQERGALAFLPRSRARFCQLLVEAASKDETMPPSRTKGGLAHLAWGSSGEAQTPQAQHPMG